MGIFKFAGTHFKGLWGVVNRSTTVRRWLSKRVINAAIKNGPTRPHPLSLKSEYSSWDSLTDRSYTGRHLPPVKRQPDELRPVDEVARIFAYRDGKWKESAKSTLLFAYFAQWFTDGFLRTDRDSERRQKNTSNHNIDLSPLYGLNREQTNILRTEIGGRLESQEINGEEYPPYLYENGVEKEKYDKLNMLFPSRLPPVRRATLFAMGGDRANVQIGYSMLNVLFLREHNRVCGRLAQANPSWDDERLFQTARNVLIATTIKLVIEEYINHIQGTYFKLIADPLAFTNEPWYRPNWMTVEFNLLYRWHSLTPPKILYDDKPVPIRDTMFHNELITSRGLGMLFDESSGQPAGEIGLHNTADFLVTKAEEPSIKQGRDAELASYNDYREMCRLRRVTDFDQITDDKGVQQELKELYGHVDNIEFYVGLFSEDPEPNSVVSELMGRMVAFDAFSQALTNPLLSQRVFNEKTFSPEGMGIINSTSTLSDILHRNVPDKDREYRVSLTRLDR